MARRPWVSVAVGWLCVAVGTVRGEVGPEDVKRSIERGCDWLLTRGSRSAYMARYPVGTRALRVFALLHCGIAADDARIANDIGLINIRAARGTYSVGLAAMCLARVDPVKHRGQLEAAVAWLTRAQNRDGGWRYSIVHAGRQSSDHSCTQFALLGLHAAAQAGVPVDQKVWQRAVAYHVATHCPDGGWSYRSRSERPFGSMTAAGVGSLYLCERHLDPGRLPCGAYKPNPLIAHGLTWLSRNFAVNRNPGRGGTPYYYLYALERVGILSARRHLGTHGWYRAGVGFIANAQRIDGSWGELADTCFALLFLAKGNVPLFVQKVEREGRWNEDPNDVRRMVEHVVRDLRKLRKEPQLELAWQHLPLAAEVEDWAVSPLLFFSGREFAPLAQDERDKLRRFIQNGGTALVEAQCSSKQFDADFKVEAGFGDQDGKLFPETKLLPLPSDHPIYTTPFPIEKAEHRVLYGLWYACRTAVVYSPRDLSSAWAGRASRGPRPLPRQVALHLATNIAAYVLGIKPVQDRLARVKLLPEDQDAGPPRNTVTIALLKHGGHWNPRPSMPKNLARELSKQAAARTAIQSCGLPATDPKLYDYPVVHMTGTRGFRLDADEVVALRKYLEAGGFLFADACAGNRAFDKAFRTQIARVLPRRKLVELPLGHPIYRSCHQITTVAYLPPVLKEFPGLHRPKLEGIEIEGRLAVVYSAFDIGCALEDYPCPLCRGYARESAQRLAVNILVYGTSF